MDTKLIQEFNKQINHEFYSAYLYFAMSTYFDEIAMRGFCSFMKHKASYKLSIAQRIYDYLILRDEKLSFAKIEEPNIDWINVTDVFSSALSHEEFMLKQILELYKTARESDDIGAVEFIGEILTEVQKDVGILRKINVKIKSSNIISANINNLDVEFKMETGVF